MIELLRTNDLVLISAIEAILKEEGIIYFVADQHTSAVEGSIGFLPRRIMVDANQADLVRHILRDAGMGGEIGNG